ncbi:MAG: hypothetical protein MPN21_11785 [Thermoanaerobaculia bacterium]|nr:hypothetical protein [Thermoanaerobaculia bacterium]
MWSEAAARIGTLTVRHPASAAGQSSPTALRLAVTAQLAGADLLPVELPPSVVLVVRRLADPLPGRLAPRPGVPRTDPAWESAVRSRLAGLYRSASRPADGPVPATAPAVCFRDRAELLACLTRDLVSGGAGTWWWRVVRRGLPASLGDLLAEHARELPATLVRLVEMNAVRQVMSALDREAAIATLVAMVEAHRLDPALVPPGRAIATPQSAPWENWLPDSGTALPTGEHSALLGLAMGLAHCPSEVRSAVFLSEVQSYWRRSGAIAQEDARVSQPSVESQDDELGSSGLRDQAQETSDRSKAERREKPFAPIGHLSEEGVPAPKEVGRSSREAGRSFGDEMAVSSHRSSVADATHPAAASDLEDVPRLGEELAGDAPQSPDISWPGAVETAPTEQLAAGVPAGLDADSTSAQEPATSRHDSSRTEWQDPVAALTEGVDTGLGGVLYLINALPHLTEEHGELGNVWDLAPRIGSSPLSGWGVLELFARGLVDEMEYDPGSGPDRGGSVDADPIWAALATLRGRSHDMRHGLPDILLQALRQRLAAALGDEPWRPELATVLLAVPGRLYVTGTHVDLVVPLDHISVPVRQAGLDRDPGWVPELGRVVLFHFR